MGNTQPFAGSALTSRISVASSSPSLGRPDPAASADLTNPLGSFLRARRALVSPAQAGIHDTGGRRVTGLRREEVALLAGISADYYLRLERGRDRRPSVQVLESLARVLHLDDAHLAYLLSLAADAPRRPRPVLQDPPAGAVKLIESMAQPALIEDRYFTVVASNDLARALSPDLSVGSNRLRDLFLNPAVRALYPEWETVTECFVASLRHAMGSDLDDPGFVHLAAELSAASPRFRQLWERHEVRGQSGALFRIQHPEVGELFLNGERLSIGGADGMMMVVFHPDAQSADAEKLMMLAAVAPRVDGSVRDDRHDMAGAQR